MGCSEVKRYWSSAGLQVYGHSTVVHGYRIVHVYSRSGEVLGYRRTGIVQRYSCSTWLREFYMRTGVVRGYRRYTVVHVYRCSAKVQLNMCSTGLLGYRSST
jgi:hypothetical protein